MAHVHKAPHHHHHGHRHHCNNATAALKHLAEKTKERASSISSVISSSSVSPPESATASRSSSVGNAEWFHSSLSDPNVLIPYTPAVADLLERSWAKGIRTLRFRSKTEKRPDFDIDLVEMKQYTPAGIMRVVRNSEDDNLSAADNSPWDSLAALHAEHNAPKQAEQEKWLQLRDALQKMKKKVDVGEQGKTRKEVVVFEIPDEDFDW